MFEKEITQYNELLDTYRSYISESLFWLFIQPIAALGVGELLYGVAQGGAGHGVGAGLEPAAEFIGIAFAGFTQKPAHGLLDKVVFVIKQYLGDCIGISSLAVTYELHGAYHSYALLPDSLAAAPR